MKTAKRHHRKHCLPIQEKFPFQTSVFYRRVKGVFGADHGSFSLKHPDLDMAVDGYKQRIARLMPAAD